MKGRTGQFAKNSGQAAHHNIFAIREARGGQSRSDDRNGMLSPNLPLVAGTMNDDNWSAAAGYPAEKIMVVADARADVPGLRSGRRNWS